MLRLRRIPKALHLYQPARPAVKYVWLTTALAIVSFASIFTAIATATPDGSASNALNHDTANDCIRMENYVGHFTSGFTIHNYISNVTRGRSSGCGGSPNNWVDNEYSVFESTGISPPNPVFCYASGAFGWANPDLIYQDDYWNSTPCGSKYYATSSNHYLSWYTGNADDYYLGMVSGWNYLHT